MILPFHDVEEPPYIIWDGGTQRFRDANTGRFVSNLAAIPYLSLNNEGGIWRYRDMAGRFAPDPVNLVYGTSVFVYSNVTREWSPIGDDAYIINAPINGYYASMGIYRRDDGSVGYVTVYSKIGTAIDFDDERRRLTYAIATQEGYDIGEKGSEWIYEQIASILHWSVQ